MMFSTVILTTIIVFAVFYIQQRFVKQVLRKRYITSHGCKDPARYPQKVAHSGTDFSNEYSEARNRGDYFRYTRDLFLKLGSTWMVTVDKKPWLFTCDPENIKTIATAKNGLFAVKPSRQVPGGSWIGDGIITSDGVKWKTSRALFKPMFARAEYANLEKFEKHVDKLLELGPGNGGKVDLQVLFKRMYFDVSTELFFGTAVNALEPEKALFDLDEFEDAFEHAMSGMGRRALLGTRLDDSKDPDAARWRQSCAKVYKVFDDCIENALNTPFDSTKRVSMVHELAKVSSDRQFLRDQLLNVFIGGKDTAAIGIADVFFHLARRPDVWDRLRQEVLEIPLDANLSYERLRSFSYMQQVIRESLRLLSPVFITLRHVKEDTILPRGGGSQGTDPVFVAAGTRVEANFGSLHYDRGIWGEDSTDFKPERWQHRTQESWEYVPFMAGNRICPAQQMVLTQYSAILARFARRFKTLENCDPVHEYVPRIVFSQESENGVQVALHS